MTPAQRRLAWFIAVGCVAAGVHFSGVVALVQLMGMPPLWANCAAWVMALGVSFAGHWRLSFADQQAPLGRAARRFVALSAAGFAVNETVYALLLRYSTAGYQAALAITLALVAVGTFLLSRHWAFRGSSGAGP